MKTIIIIVLSGWFCSAALAQKETQEKTFFEKYKVGVTPVKNQSKTGTCWSFATTSFIESELLRMGKGQLDLSEMFFVRYAYFTKAQDYIRYHGSGNFSQGGQAHDVLNVIREFGFVPESDYTGLKYGMDIHDHSELSGVLTNYLKALLEKKKLTTGWKKGFTGILDGYLGKIPAEITINNSTMTPVKFAESLGFNPDDYVELTSYNHHPYYTKFVLEVPDNWSNDQYYNLPINDLMNVMRYAIKKGYSFCWDGDLERGDFNFKKGIAAFNDSLIITNIQQKRQETFDNWETTDDHLMHIVGLSEDEEGEKYFITKNSWGEDRNDFEGYLNMSFDYVSIKTIAIMVHKDAIPAAIANKLFH